MTVLRAKYQLALALSVMMISVVALTQTVKAQSRALDQMVAVVNNEAITLSEYAARHQREYLGGESDLSSAYQPGRINPDVLGRMLNDRVIVQAAKRRGINASDAEVAAAVQGIAQNNNTTVGELYAQITADGLSPSDFRESIREQIIKRRIVDLEVNSRIEISDNEVEEFLKQQNVQAPVEETYEILHILFATDGKSAETITLMREKMDELLARVNGLEDFANLANEYSAASNGEDGGYLGWRSKSQLPAIFVEALDGMQINTMSEVFESENGFHVLFLKDTEQQALTQQVVQENISHILIRSDGFKGRSEQEAKGLVDDIYARIENGDDFESMARIYSEDPRTIDDNGLIGWVDETQMSRAILDEVAKINVNEITSPVRSAAGWHIIRLNNRRELTAQEIIMQNRARSLLFRDKAAERFDEWFNALKDNAFIEIVRAR